MGVRIFMFSFSLTSILFFLLYLYIPFNLTIPITRLPDIIINFTPPNNPTNATTTTTYPVTFAYLISASKGDVAKLKRVLRALYHPANFYLIHMDSGASRAEHRQVAEFVAAEPVFSRVGNVWVVGKPNLVTYRGPTMLATTLHAMAMLLRSCNWDWFINLSASDYPLVTQDGMVSELFL